MNTCSIDGCEGVVYGHDWCNKHWQRWKKTGDPLGVRPTRWERKKWPVCSVEGCDLTSKGGGKGLCKKHLHKEWRAENPDKMREHHKKYRESHPESIKAGKLKCYFAKRDQYDDRNNENAKKYRKEFKTYYIKELMRLAGFKEEDLTPELIGAYRSILKLKRKIKEMENGG